jgi:WD40 repeat protein
MELSTGLSLLVQGLPSIVELLTAIQQERVTQLKQNIQAKEKPDLAAKRQRAIVDRETQLQLATYQRETDLQLLEHRQVVEQWPLGLLPTQLLEASAHQSSMPLQILLAPPQKQFAADRIPASASMESVVAQGLADFLNQHYPLNSPTRPTELLTGAWRDRPLQREAQIKALFDQLRARPTLVLETEIFDAALTIRIAYWGLHQNQYCYRPIITDLPWQKLVHAAAKRRALKWQETAAKLLALGEDPAIIHQLGEDNVHNLDLLERETKWQQHGIDLNSLQLPYQIRAEDFADLNQLLTTIYCLLSGWIADAHYLLDAGVTPLLPGLMPELTRSLAIPELEEILLQTMLAGYRDLFHTLETENSIQVPEFALKLAQSLSQLADRTWAKAQIRDSLNRWFAQRQLAPPTDETLWQTLRSALRGTDRAYLTALYTCFGALEDEQNAAQVETLLQTFSQQTLSQPQAASSLSVQLPGSFNQRSLRTEIAAASAGTHALLPQRTIALTHTLTGYAGKSASLAFCEQGQILASVRDDCTIKLQHIESGEIRRTLMGKAGRIMALALSADGQILASSHRTSDRSDIKVWHLPTGQLLQTLAGHHKRIYALAISPDRQFLVSGGHKIKVWDLQTGQLRQTLNGHQDWVYSLAIDAAGKTLISAGADKTIKLWHLPTGKLLHVLTGHLDWVRSLALSPDGQLLASGSDDNTVRLWHLGSGKLLQTLIGHSNWVSAVVISPDRQMVISGSKDNTIRLWQVESGQLLNTLTQHQKQIYALAISPDGQTIASGSEDKTILIWRRNLSSV